jgi:hypothetical protein
MSAACFPRSQAAGDSQVTFSVPLLSPPILYNWHMPGTGKRDPITRPLRSDAMNGNTGGHRSLRRAGTLAVMAAVAVLATACGMVHVSFSGGSAPAFRQNVAYAHCMQSHGAPNFPTPANPSERFHISGRPHGKAIGPLARANEACQHLLPRGSVTTSSGRVTQSPGNWPGEGAE